jgi:hypothetical protein
MNAYAFCVVPFNTIASDIEVKFKKKVLSEEMQQTFSGCKNEN